jgi:hypothetical protein
VESRQSWLMRYRRLVRRCDRMHEHIEHVLAKLGFASRAQIAAWSGLPDLLSTTRITGNRYWYPWSAPGGGPLPTRSWFPSHGLTKYRRTATWADS